MEKSIADLYTVLFLDVENFLVYLSYRCYWNFWLGSVADFTATVLLWGGGVAQVTVN